MPKSDLTFAWTTINDALAEGFEDALFRNWEEIDDTRWPLAIDWQSYRRFEREGVTRLGLLHKGGVYVGHNVFFVQPTLHHRRSVWAINDLIWLDPAHRKGRTGIFMIVEAERLLREAGARQIIYTSKVALNAGDPRATVGPLLHRLGYARAEETWTKLLP